MFKYNLGQVVWYMKDNKVHTAKIGARLITEVDPESKAAGNWSPRLLYGTVHGNWNEDQLYHSADALLHTLKSSAIVG